MSDLDQLAEDLLALIASYLSVKDLLFFLRSHRQIHQLNSSNKSFAVSAWANSQLCIRVERSFDEWIIPSKDYIYDQYREGFISLSMWHSIRSVMVSVFQYWIDSDYCNDEIVSEESGFDFSLAKKLIETSENPASKIVTSASGEKVQVLENFNYEIFSRKLSPQRWPCCLPRFILSTTPNLSSLAVTIDGFVTRVSDPDNWLKFVPHLRSLKIRQQDSNQSHIEKSIIPIRQTLSILTELESLTTTGLMLGIQDMIDIAAHSKLAVIKLTSKEVSALESDWLTNGIDFNSHSQFPDSDGTNYSNFGDEEDENEQNDKRKKQKLHVNYDEQFAVEGDNELMEYDDEEDWPPEATPERMAADIAYIQTSLSLSSSSSASQRARLNLVDYLKSQLYQPLESQYFRPLVYLRHLRRQIFMLQSALSEQVKGVHVQVS